jgi:hypothetical protein
MAALLLLGIAAGAQASLGVTGSTASQGNGQGQLTQPRGVAINGSGAGGVPAGTTYVAEQGNGRISQLGPDGEFVRAFGRGVVQSGDDNSVQQERVDVDATAGTYRLRLTSAQGEGHVNGTDTVTGLRPTYGTFQVGDQIEGTGIPAGTTILTVGTDTLKLSASATGTGDPFLVATETTADIDAAASPSTLESALEALPVIVEKGGVEVEGGPGGPGAKTPYLVSWAPGAFSFGMSAVAGGTPLSGGAGTASVAAMNSFGAYEICNASPPSNDVCGSSFGSATGVAVSQVTGDVYVRVERAIDEYSASGEHIRTFGGDAVISGPDNVPAASARQEIDIPSSVTGGTFTLEFGGDTTAPIAYEATAAAVRSSLESLASIGTGNIAVAGGDGATAPFLVTFSGALSNNPEPAIAIDSENLIGGSGTVTVTEPGANGFEVCGPIDNCRPGEGGSAAGFFGGGLGYLAVAPAGAPNAGNVVAADPGNRRVQEFSADGDFIRAFGFGVVAAGPDDNGSGFEECRLGDACRAGIEGSGTGQFAFGEPLGVAADSTGAIYTVEGSSNFRVQKFTPQPGPVALSPSIFGSDGAPNGSDAETAPTQVAIGAGDHLLVVKGVAAGATSSCPDEAPSSAEDRVLELSSAGALLDTHMACNGIERISGIAYDSDDGSLRATIVPQTYPQNQLFEVGPVEPPSVSLDSVGEISSSAVKVSGSVNPRSGSSFANPVRTSYQLEYKLHSDSSWIKYSQPSSVGAGTADVPVDPFLSGLTPNSSYDVRLVATKQFREGDVRSVPETFTTLAAAPEISSFSSSDVSESEANLHATIDGFGEATTYRFEYGTTSSYGSSAPIPDGELEALQSRQPVTAHITGLNGGTYHFRVVAENGAGTTTTGDQTFNFFPPSCPNSHLRQQTGASYLPDCRAYELVSPSNAGNVTLEAGGPYSPVATSPSRFTFTGYFGGIEGSGDPPTVGHDLYVATRHSSGWVTKFVGIPGTQGAVIGGPPPLEGYGNQLEGIRSSLDLSKVIDWDRGQRNFTCCGLLGSFAPYMWSSEGSPLGRLPTNLSEVSGADADLSDGGFKGGTGISPDFSHYVFSSDTPFAAGGIEGVPGSAYDNDIAAGTVTPISKTASGDDIPAGQGSSHPYIEFPAISTDGSHILMSTEGLNGTRHLYMAVDDVHHYDVSIGTDGLDHAVQFVGMTPDGSTVYFASAEPLSADDHDTSTDMFMWSEDSPGEVTRISAGEGGGGDSDACTAAWTSGCGAPPVSTGIESDNPVAAGRGDVYFYSPEQLDGAAGTPGERNLYRYSEGAVHFVATLFGNAMVNRIQVSPDGRNLALVTAASLTPQSTGGHLAMYHVDVSTDQIKCVSCNPDGTVQSYDVAASQNGLFMSNDGRTFFSTKDSLVPQDTNGLVDSYEYVDNRPQLLTSGTGDQDSGTGFVSVSADGVDAYFATKESFVGQDTVGPFLKFYDARVGGGIPFAVPPAPCAAADECHGASSEPPGRIPSSTGAPLGSGGNLKSAKHHKKKKHHKKMKKKRRRGHRRHVKNGGGHRG